MAEIFVPGDEVARVGVLLGRVMDLVDTQNSGFDARAVGAPLVDAGMEFDRAWDDGRVQLKKNCRNLKDGCEAVVKSFADLDAEMGAALTDAGGGATDGGVTAAPGPTEGGFSAAPGPAEGGFSAAATAGSVIA
ncbi:hypothetical protein ACIQNG_05755 [Streptomyces sp. NPDC091377]|uniref:hypothetical protein n=1 Tax=Streptomyces sp. NPDC091377 TaxID=3365995 RepID=UPI0038149EA9